jgi:hypothetical protein
MIGCPPSDDTSFFWFPGLQRRRNSERLNRHCRGLRLLEFIGRAF